MIRKIVILSLLALICGPCRGALPGNAPEKWSEGIAQTVMTRYPSALAIPFKPWCYPQGYFLTGLGKLWATTGDRQYYDYIMNWAESVVCDDGTPVYFRGRSMDDMMAGAVVVWAYRQTGKEKFRKAAETIRRSYDDYPRTSDGIFWHGRGTVGQIWVDGVFMGQMFLTAYGKYIGDADYCFGEAARQLKGMYSHLHKDDSGLLLHGWDEDKDARWADPQTGFAPEVWSEGLGWYALIMVESLDLFPKNHPDYGELLGITRRLMAGLKRTQDPATGLWYQVVDRGGEPGNWHETSGSAMFVYAMQRAIDLGIVKAEDYSACVVNGYYGLLSKAKISLEDGLIDLHDANDGLGIQKDYEAYVSRPRKMNGQEVISSFLWATWLVENRYPDLKPLAVRESRPSRFVCTDYSGGRVMLYENDSIVWEHEAPLSNDVWALDNGNILFTAGNAVLEMTTANDTVFYYNGGDNHIFACQRLKNGNTFIGECESGCLLEVSPEVNIVKEICILPEGDKRRKSFIRNARRLDNGHYLVAHYGGKKVIEYDADGKNVWEVPVSGGAHSVVRLPDGNTLVAVADADKNARIIEFNPRKEVVWQLSNDDFPESRPFKFLTGMQYIPEKEGLLFTNWQGHGVKEKVPHMFFITRDKRILYTFGHREGIETLSSVCVADFNSKNALH